MVALSQESVLWQAQVLLEKCNNWKRIFRSAFLEEVQKESI